MGLLGLSRYPDRAQVHTGTAFDLDSRQLPVIRLYTMPITPAMSAGVPQTFICLLTWPYDYYRLLLQVAKQVLRACREKATLAVFDA